MPLWLIPTAYLVTGSVNALFGVVLAVQGRHLASAFQFAFAFWMIANGGLLLNRRLKEKQ